MTTEPIAVLAGATEPSGSLDRLRVALAARADSSGVLDVAYRYLDTPVGRLLLAATPSGLVRVAYAREDHDAVLAALAGSISPRVLEAPARLDAAARQLDEYFAHRRTAIDLPLDLQLRRGFRLLVLERLRDVPYGSTVSYGSLAAVAGNPRASRAVGTACATNPLPVVIPCHRVVRGDGTPGGYVGGAAAKHTLLELERS
jgi:methylated-DNA-[protein]-cysteine S-methyltransferase